jgi:hypothetical protein
MKSREWVAFADTGAVCDPWRPTAVKDLNNPPKLSAMMADPLHLRAFW